MNTKKSKSKKTQTKTVRKPKKIITPEDGKIDSSKLQNAQPVQNYGSKLGAAFLYLLIILGACAGFMALLKYGLEYAFDWEIDSEYWWTISGIVAGLSLLGGLISGLSKK